MRKEGAGARSLVVRQTGVIRILAIVYRLLRAASETQRHNVTELLKGRGGEYGEMPTLYMHVLATHNMYTTHAWHTYMRRWITLGETEYCIRIL